MAGEFGRSGRTCTIAVLVLFAFFGSACTSDLLDGHGQRGAAPTRSAGDFPRTSAAPSGAASSSTPSAASPDESITFELSGTSGPFATTVTVDGKSSTYRVRLPWTRMYDGSASEYQLTATIRNGDVDCRVVRGDGTVLITAQAGASGGGTAKLSCARASVSGCSGTRQTNDRTWIR